VLLGLAHYVWVNQRQGGAEPPASRSV